MCARFRENVRSLKDLKISLFPLSRVKGAERHKKMHLGSQSFFFGSRLPKKFWSSFSATFEEGPPLWKKEAKRRHETSTVNQQLLSLSCVVLAARRGETLFIVKGFGERKGAELLLLLLTRFIERTIYHLLRFKADSPLLFFLRCF